MTKNGGESPLWALIGKLAALVALIGGTLTLIKTCSAPTGDLDATIEGIDFQLPPQYTAFSERLDSAIEVENIEKILKKVPDETQDKHLSSAISSVSYSLSIALRDQLKPDVFSSFEVPQTYWKGEVRNVGSLAVEKVALRVPGAMIAVIEREDKSKTIDSKGPVLEIGSIAAGEKVSIAAWSNQYGTPLFEKPTVYHAGGIGSVHIKGEPTFMEFVSAHVFELVWGGVTLFLVCLVFVSAAVERQKKAQIRVGTKADEKSSDNTQVRDG